MSTLLTSHRQWCNCGERLPWRVDRTLVCECKVCGRPYRAKCAGATTIWMSTTTADYIEAQETENV